jgi:hypothetical protein
MRTAMLHGNPARPNVYHHDQGNGEFYAARGGLTFSHPDIAAHFKAKGGLYDTPASEPWMPTEAAHVRRLMQTNQATMITGDLGAGKSTVMYGVRTLMRAADEAYTVINGHYLDAADRIVRAIERLDVREEKLIYDSFDYLFMHRRNKRAAANKARPMVLEAVHDFLGRGGTMLATMHTEPWMVRNSTAELTEQLHGFVAETGAETYRVTGYVEDNETLANLATKVIGEEYGSLYPAYAGTSTEPTARTYRVMKLMGHEIGSAGLMGMAQTEFDERVQTIDDATRQKMGAPADYSFLPGIAAT